MKKALKSLIISLIFISMCFASTACDMDKHPYLLGFTSVSIIALFFGIEVIINEIIDSDKVSENVKHFIFFANSQTQTISFRSASLYLIIGSTAIISSLFILIINKCVLGSEKSAFLK